MQTLENTYMLEKVFALALVGVTVGLLLRRVRDKVRSAGALSGIPGFGETPGEEMQVRPVEGFDHVGGIEQVIEELTYLRDEIRDVGQGSQEYEIPKGLLFYGPPGTGKTMLARALAAETNCPFISFKGSDLSTELFIGTGIRKVRSVFEQARKLRDRHTKELQTQGVSDARGVCIVFIDEFDSIAARRPVAMGETSAEETRVVNMLLTELDNIHKGDQSKLSNRDILVIAATNDLANLDPAVIRNGRFNRKIEIPAPHSKLTRLDILDKATKYGFEPKGWTIQDRDTSLDRLARMAVGSSGADLVGVLDKAQAISRRRGNDKIITFDDIMEGFQQQNFGFKMSSIINAAERRKTAYHELVGHGAIAWACEIATFLISMEPRGKSLGRVIPDPEAMSELAPTKQQLLQRILVSVAGQVAEELRYGELGATVGNTGDLDSSRDILRLLISTGLVGDDVAVSLLEARGGGNKTINDNQQRLINKAIGRAKDTVESILSTVSNDQWDVIIDELLALDKELIGDEAQEFLEKHLGGREDLRETARRALEAYYRDPIGENQTDR
jgi:cell division protease FtsH